MTASAPLPTTGENDSVASSWEDLIGQLYAESWHQALNRFRSSYVFRGLADKDFALRTSLQRLGGRYDGLETHIIRNFKKYAVMESAGRYSIWNWLVLAQHHGLPTRLLDWTFSPFVAMHFATSNLEEYDSDGVIWCADFVKLHGRLPASLQKRLAVEAAASCFTVEMLGEIAQTLVEFDALSGEAFILFFDPPSIDQRIVNQFALHSVISDPRTDVEEILAAYPGAFKRVIIPKGLKWEVRDKLDQANINERVLFPGLDGLSMWLKRHYSPR